MSNIFSASDAWPNSETVLLLIGMRALRILAGEAIVNTEIERTVEKATDETSRLLVRPKRGELRHLLRSGSHTDRVLFCNEDRSDAMEFIFVSFCSEL